MAHAIVLSKDRAAQLQLCLESIQYHGSHIFSNISVLYYTSTPEFKLGYDKTKERFPQVSFIQQTSYYEDIMELVNESYPLTSFFTDDDIIYDSIPLSENILMKFFDEYDILGTFSLRLGLNTIIQDPYISSQAIAPTSGFHQVDDRIIMWRWDHCPSYGNFGYPLSVDGHIFRTQELKKILYECKFKNPNQQEVAMQVHLNKLPSIMAAFNKSVVINTPINRVQEICLNRAGENFGQTIEEMNQRYLNNEVLDFDSIDFSNIIGCHQELDIKWTMK